MSWISLGTRARELGFDLAFHVQASDGRLVPDFLAGPAGKGWLLVGNYEHVAAIWVRPITDAAKSLSSRCIAATLGNFDPFVEIVGDYDEDYFAAGAPARAAALYPDRGRMLA